MVILLSCHEVSKRFGGLQALKEVDLNVKEHEIIGLVGPNGSGKSTLLNIVSGYYKLDSGTVLLMGEKISNVPPHQICTKGIARTSQIVQSFPEMTTIENVLVGALFGGNKKGREKKDPLKRSKELLGFVGIPESKFNLPVKNLNLAELRRVQLAKALATEPKLLLLDELLAGLNPKESDEAIELIKKIRDQGITILLVEHIMRIIMGLCDRVIVLHHGEKIADGPPNEILKDETIIKLYLGKKYILSRD
jgi:branched-chain amino acid transport system ATP-binding protein